MTTVQPAVTAEILADGVGVLTLNRAERRNAMSIEMVDALEPAMATLEKSNDVRAIVVTGAGKSFCSGADFTVMAELGQRTGLEGFPALHGAIRSLYQAFLTIYRSSKPTVAAVNGAAVGGGLGIALLCDIRVMAAEAKVGANFSRLGIHPGLGISHLLPRLIGYERAAELLLTGEFITGERAAALGLCREAVPVADVVPRSLALAAAIAASAPLAVQAIKRTLRLAHGVGMEAVLELEAHAQAQLGQTADAREGIQAMLAKRTPVFQGK